MLRTLCVAAVTAAVIAPAATDTFDRAAYVFVHELMHSIGVPQENLAECLDLFMFRYELRRWWGYTAAAAQIAWDRGLTLHQTMPTSYQGCVEQHADVVSYANGL